MNELLELCPSLKIDFPKSFSKNGIQVLQILYLSGGFRPLDNSNSSIQTLMAVGLTKTEFSRAYKELSDKGLVKGDSSGLHFTDLGEKLVSNQIKDQLKELNRKKGKDIHNYWKKLEPKEKALVKTILFENPRIYANINYHIFHRQRKVVGLAGYFLYN